MEIQYFLFLVGFLLQSFSLVRKRGYKKFLSVLIFSLFIASFFFFRIEEDLTGYSFNLCTFTLTFIFVFVILFFFTYINDILFQINELLLLSFTLIFWYAFLLNNRANPFLIFLLLIPTFGTIFLSFTRFQLKDYQKLIFYLWFLSIDTYLFVSYFLPKNIIPFIFFEETNSVSLFSSFFGGSSFLYLACNMLCFSLLFPIESGGKSFRLQSPRETFKAIMRNVKPLVAKYSNEEAKIFHSLLLIMLQGAFLLLNYFYKFLPPSLLINFFIVILPPLLVRKIEPEEVSDFLI